VSGVYPASMPPSGIPETFDAPWENRAPEMHPAITFLLTPLKWAWDGARVRPACSRSATIACSETLT
jgi:hypothetical protein